MSLYNRKGLFTDWSEDPRERKFYRTWKSMKTRTSNRNSKKYSAYGGRGISVCEEWIKFECFYRDMWQSFVVHYEEHGAKDTIIDRIDVNGNYEPDNCRWVTTLESMRNQQNSRWLTFNEETLAFGDWAKKIGINRASLEERITNWGIEKALSTPRIELNEKTPRRVKASMKNITNYNKNKTI